MVAELVVVTSVSTARGQRIIRVVVLVAVVARTNVPGRRRT